MVKNSLFIICTIFCYFHTFSECSNLALVFFKDKENKNISLDAPVNKNYIQKIESIGLEYKNSSRWLNAAIFIYNDVEKINSIKQLDFVEKLDFGCINNQQRTNTNYSKFETEKISEIEENQETNIDTIYNQQILQVKGNYIQNLNYKAQGMKIAVIDNGFPNANIIEGLQHIYNENRLLGTYNFYTNSINVYHSSGNNHGSNCFSIIGGLLSNFSGSAPKASFYLFRTEVDAIEGQTEEILLSQALEAAYDSGVHVASISLGYTEGFDDGTNNHTYAELDGKTTIAAKAVNIAASKGMIVCVSAGNEGNKTWKYLGTPADADSAFTIGAVDANGDTSSFTSYQFENTTKVKPNVVAMGTATQYLNSANTISSGNGTSYSTPVIAGLTACLWQAFPEKTNWEIKTAIEQSAHLYPNTDNKRLGYGIPDFEKAYKSLAEITKIDYNINNEIKVFPTLFSDKINISSNNNIKEINIYTTTGKLINSLAVDEQKFKTIVLDNLESNIYLLQIITEQNTITKKVIKQ